MPLLSPIDPPRFPGWYLDPNDTDVERFWNGADFTDLERPAPRLSDYTGPIEPALLAAISNSGPLSIESLLPYESTSLV